MSTLTNSLRPTGQTSKPISHAYHAHRLQGSCTKCGSRSYQIVNIRHPIFKMVCPDCRTYLTELRQQAAQRNKEAAAANLANKK